MFKRTLSVDIVKKAKTQPVETELSGPGFEEKATIVGNIVENSIVKVGIAVVAYVIIDTVRKVAVASVSE